MGIYKIDERKGTIAQWEDLQLRVLHFIHRHQDFNRRAAYGAALAFLATGTEIKIDSLLGNINITEFVWLWVWPRKVDNQLSNGHSTLGTNIKTMVWKMFKLNVVVW